MSVNSIVEDKGGERFVGKLARLLFERFPVNDHEIPSTLPPYLQRDVGLVPDEPSKRWHEHF